MQNKRVSNSNLLKTVGIGLLATAAGTEGFLTGRRAMPAAGARDTLSTMAAGAKSPQGSSGAPSLANSLPSPVPAPAPAAPKGSRSFNLTGPGLTDAVAGLPVTINGQALTLGLDTGSINLNVFASSCTECTQNTTGYVAGASDAADVAAPVVSLDYGAGTFTGIMAQGRVSLPGTDAMARNFFLAEDSTAPASLLSGVDGIIGFAPAANVSSENSNPDSSIIEVIFKTLNTEPFFSLDLCGEAGVLTVGQANAEVAPAHAAPMLDTEDTWGFPLYGVWVQAMGLTSSTAPVIPPVPGGTAYLLDSGSIILQVTEPMYDAVAAHLNNASLWQSVPVDRGSQYEACVEPVSGPIGAEVLDAQLPTLVYTMTDAESSKPFNVTFRGSQYMLPFKNGTQLCHALQPGDFGDPSATFATWGHAGMMGHRIAHDLTTRTIGFAPKLKDCHR